MATKNGVIKKTPLAEYDSSRKTGLQGIALKDDDELISVKLTDGEDNVVMVTKRRTMYNIWRKRRKANGKSFARRNRY